MTDTNVNNITSALNSLIKEPSNKVSKTNIKAANIHPTVIKFQENSRKAKDQWYGLYHRKDRLSKEASLRSGQSQFDGFEKIAGAQGVGWLAKLLGKIGGGAPTGVAGEATKGLLSAAKGDGVLGGLTRTLVGPQALKDLGNVRQYLNSGSLATREAINPSMLTGPALKSLALSPAGLATAAGGTGYAVGNTTGQAAGRDQTLAHIGNLPFLQKLMLALQLPFQNADSLIAKGRNFS